MGKFKHWNSMVGSFQISEEQNFKNITWKNPKIQNPFSKTNLKKTDFNRNRLPENYKKYLKKLLSQYLPSLLQLSIELFIDLKF